MSDPRNEDEDEVQDDTVLDPRVVELLADPLMWEQPAPEQEDVVVALIAAERGAAAAAGEDRSAPQPPVAVSAAAERWARHANRRAWVRPFAAGAAAAAVVAVLLVGGAALVGSDDDHDGGTEVALSGTDLAPAASADATVIDTPLGTVIELDVRDLEPAPDGAYYEAWLRAEGEDGDAVSAGTFHLRGGDGRVQLWSGVTPEAYPVLTVTLQQEGAGASSSGEVVLRGAIGD